MSLETRSYAGKLFRPKIETFYDSSIQFLIATTAWGARAAAKQTADIMNDFYQSFLQDKEATSPFPRSPNLSLAGNTLRSATLLANDHIFSTYNKEEYKNGVELFAAIKTESELIWVTVGQPQFLLVRESKPCLPLSIEMDLAYDFSATDQPLAPIPNQFLGLEKSIEVSVHSIKIQKSDQFILLSRTTIPTEVLSMSNADISIDSISRACAKDDANMPFWLGIWNPEL